MKRGLLLLVLTAGCAARAPMIPAPTAPDPVTLHDPGRAPRRTLRLHLATGSRETSVLSVRPLRHVFAKGVERVEGGPLQIWQTEITVGPQDRYQQRLGEPEAKLRYAGGGVVSDRGLVREASLAAKASRPPPVDPTVLVIPFPEAAVGPGARWETFSEQEHFGAKWRFRQTFQLVELWESGGVVEMSAVAVSQQPTGTLGRDKVDAVEAKIKGRFTFREDALLPGGDVRYTFRGKQADESVVELTRRLVIRPIAGAPLVDGGPLVRAPDERPVDTRLAFLHACRTLDASTGDGSPPSVRLPGFPWAEGTCRDGRAEGPWRSFDPAGRLSWEGEFSAGRPHGRWVQWSESGERLASMDLPGGNGMFQMRWTRDVPRVEVGLRAGLLDGEFRAFDRDGRLRDEGRFQRGQRAGVWRSWRADGAPGLAYRHEPTCALVAHVEPGSPAALAGVQTGDVVRAAGGAEIAIGPHAHARLLAIIAERGAEPIPLQLEREGQPLSVQLPHGPTRGRLARGLLLACLKAQQD